MAIKKEVTFENGVKINYHRVDEISVDNRNKKLKVSVLSYTDDNYRNKEIENTKNQTRYEELMLFIIQENEKNESDRNIKQVKKWSKEANELVTKFKEDISLSVIKTSVEFTNVDDFSMTNVYKLLKNTDLFRDGEDI